MMMCCVAFQSAACDDVVVSCVPSCFKMVCSAAFKADPRMMSCVACQSAVMKLLPVAFQVVSIQGALLHSKLLPVKMDVSMHGQLVMNGVFCCTPG